MSLPRTSPRPRPDCSAHAGTLRLILAGLACACQAQPPATSGEAPRVEPVPSAPPAMEPPPPAPSAPSAPPASETSAAARNGAPASARYEVLGHTLELEAKPGPCVLLHRPAAASAPGASAAGASAPGASAPGASAPRAVELGLTGPCYIMPWVKPPPPRDANGPSAAVPVGTTGDARAYTYENGVTVLLVIGGPPPPDQAERARGYTCAGDSRGVLLQGGEVRPSRRIAEGGSRLHCVEWGGPDEKEYWLFAHDPPGALTTPR